MTKVKESSESGTNNILQKHNLKTSISQSLQKWRNTFKRITHEALVTLDEASSTTDDKIDALFHNGDSASSLNTSLSSNSRTAARNSANLNARVEMRLTDETESLDGSSSDNSLGDSTSADENEDGQRTVSYDTYDAPVRCKKLRQELGEPFWQADIIWRERRDLWVEPVQFNEYVKDANSKKTRKAFKKIPIDYYPRIYQKLAVDDKPLREPLNLEDAVQVINSGWTETKKWSNMR
ncbi:hypothetical protein TPHA_0B00660 [Tetrapisispora phaffii CBS 4417]|uniref:Uncharacterized protein n=1 Tax=Tetrapisispora phaffii (strain ATCC 24235 / CBS 4417 / NBRC 1672 / NRRL Y-8282 / UCD 70-5) TaxID=1071381 RepID=G8BQE1_TETPH|nr:hypothetical protein TPHA_0B00660 [Tetrapisispora phaffii CBS 4417]CCE61738.1 hypothetical protein TPHA_0B00660 [Tetrapisispora phaffii CBS 4417]